jgi:membrane carboxypeptidase/penicillin-binding protein PbpC
MIEAELKHPTARRVDRFLAVVATFLLIAIELPNLGRPNAIHKTAYGWVDALWLGIFLTPGILVWVGTARKPTMETLGWMSMGILFCLMFFLG